MSKISEDLFTILMFSDTDGGRIYRGDRALHSLDESGLIAYEYALDDLGEEVDKIYLKSTPANSLSFDPDWETRSLSDVLTAAEDNGAKFVWHRRSSITAAKQDVVSVTYFGFDPSLSGVLTEVKFAEILEQYRYSLANEEGEPIDYSQVSSASVWVYDPATESGIAVIHDGLVEARLTSPGFESILKAMDDFVKENSGARLFLETTGDGVNEVYSGDSVYDWEFDLNSGQYVKPESE